MSVILQIISIDYSIIVSEKNVNIEKRNFLTAHYRKGRIYFAKMPEKQVKKKKNFVSAFPAPSCILHKYMV